MSASSTPTTINSTYLNNLSTSLQDLLDGVNQQLNGQGYIDNGAVMVPTLNSPQFAVAGGGGAGPGGSGGSGSDTTSGTFDAANALNTQLQLMGGTVYQELQWLQKVLTEMIDEITTTVSSMKGTDSLNSESVDTLTQDFQSTISDLNTPAVSGGSGGTGTTGSGTTGSGTTGSGTTGSGTTGSGTTGSGTTGSGTTGSGTTGG
jgi:hypothetical protein